MPQPEHNFRLEFRLAAGHVSWDWLDIMHSCSEIPISRDIFGSQIHCSCGELIPKDFITQYKLTNEEVHRGNF